MTELEHAIKHIKTRADAWAVKEVTEALQSISERLDKALSQEPTEKPKADKLCEVCVYRSGNLCVRPKDYNCRILSQEPSRRKGHWIETEYHRWRCSVCREKGMSEWDNIHDVRTNFCPDCGADMREEREEQTE